ncbi:SWIM zinc finger domain-containing protein [Halomicroarcula salina]|uniref:SWIM zinc finger domain-containing protein n=2 Tax=Haloarcula salina TaxID=1429914 RepID=A0AA41KM39_9EURY|nr:SWIM zinc finger domain-containing protein [Haloarcula salina]
MHPLVALTFSTRVAKRAQYERFAIEPVESGFRVRNESHANPAEHEYLVEMDGAVPTACTCPADERFDGACKHRVAIAIRRPDRGSAQSPSKDTTRIRGDGGPSVNSDTGHGIHSDESDSDDCKECLPDVPCWECYRQERRGFVDQ